MGVYEALKDAISIAQKADNIQLIQGLLDAQQQALELQNALQLKDVEIRQLRDEIERLKRSIELSGELVERQGWYFLVDQGGKPKHPPVCSRCWEVDGRIVHLHSVSHLRRDGKQCPQCKATFGPVPFFEDTADAASAEQ